MTNAPAHTGYDNVAAIKLVEGTVYTIHGPFEKLEAGQTKFHVLKVRDKSAEGHVSFLGIDFAKMTIVNGLAVMEELNGK